jgi:hypothetical protein
MANEDPRRFGRPLRHSYAEYGVIVSGPILRLVALRKQLDRSLASTSCLHRGYIRMAAQVKFNTLGAQDIKRLRFAV